MSPSPRACVHTVSVCVCVCVCVKIKSCEWEWSVNMGFSTIWVYHSLSQGCVCVSQHIHLHISPDIPQQELLANYAHYLDVWHKLFAVVWQHWSYINAAGNVWSEGEITSFKKTKHLNHRGKVYILYLIFGSHYPITNHSIKRKEWRVSHIQPGMRSSGPENMFR